MWLLAASPRTLQGVLVNKVLGCVKLLMTGYYAFQAFSSLSLLEKMALKLLSLQPARVPIMCVCVCVSVSVCVDMSVCVILVL